MYSSKVSHVNTELNWKVATTVKLFSFENLEKIFLQWSSQPLLVRGFGDKRRFPKSRQRDF